MLYARTSLSFRLLVFSVGYEPQRLIKFVKIDIGILAGTLRSFIWYGKNGYIFSHVHYSAHQVSLAGKRQDESRPVLLIASLAASPPPAVRTLIRFRSL